MRVDLLTLYAYSDKTHAHQRELWRGFLALIFPVLLEFDASEFERLIETAHCRSVDRMINATESPENISEFLWTASGQFAESLGFEAELGLSAFLDVELPTRIHAIQKTGGVQDKDDALIGEWLQAFRKVQQSPEFLEITTEWKQIFDLLNDPAAFASEDASPLDQDTVPVQSEDDSPAPKTSTTLRKERRRQPRRKSG